MAEGRSFAERLLLTRRRAGLTQRGLATQLGIYPADIYRMERGLVRNPRASRLIAIAEALEVSTDYLLRGLRPEDMPSSAT